MGDDHLAAIRMKIEGHTGQQIADALDVKLRTVYLWFGDPMVKDELTRQREQVFQIFAERMSEMGLMAIRGLQDMASIELEDDTRLSVGQKLDIYREILDRIPLTAKKDGKMPPTDGNYGTPSIPVPGMAHPGDGPPSDKSDAEMMKDLRELVTLMPGVSVVEANGNSSG